MQVIGRGSNRQRKAVPEFTGARNERMQIPVNSCTRDFNRIGVSTRNKTSSARLHEEWRHTVSKIRRAVSMKIAEQDVQGSSIAVDLERLNTVIKRRRTDETKDL